MAVDYDLVIIGSSKVGIYAAHQAALLQARVALVTQSDRLLLPDNSFKSQAIAEIARLNYKANNHPVAEASVVSSLNEAQTWAANVDLVQQTQNSLANLAALGVDVIADTGKFCPLPRLSFQTTKRQLRSRKFLLATGTSFRAQCPPERDKEAYLTSDELWQTDLTGLGAKIIVVGGNPAALELAQTLVRFAKEVVLVMPQPRILSSEDPEVVLMLQAQLEAEGIKIYTDAPVKQIKTIDGQKWLQAGDFALTASQIVVTSDRQPHITGLNLKEVGVKCDRRRVHVNRRLQTHNPDIYACGDLIGGYSLPSVARYEADIALKNILFFSFYRTDYNSVPWVISTQPNFARVGLTPRQAEARYGRDLYIIREYIADLDFAQISAATMGMCKLLVHQNGTVIGCTLIGDRAEELIVVISLLIRHKIKLGSNPLRGLTTPVLTAISPSMSEIWQRASDNFYRQKLRQNSPLRARLQSWHSLRRKWHQ